MGKFSQFLGKTEFEIEKVKYELNITIEDIQKLFDFKKQKENEAIYIKDMLLEIMKRSYPNEPEKELEATVVKNFMKMMEEISIALKWTTREQLEKDKKKAIEELEKKE